METARLYRHRNGGLYRVIGVSPSPANAQKGGWIEIGAGQYRATDSIKEGEDVVFYRPDESNTQSDPSRRYIRPVRTFFETGRFVPVVESSPGVEPEPSAEPDSLVSAIERLCGAMSNRLWNDSVRTERAWKEGRSLVDPPHPALAAELDDARRALADVLERYGIGDTGLHQEASADRQAATDADQDNSNDEQAYAEGFARGEASTIAHVLLFINQGEEHLEFPESLRPLRERILQLRAVPVPEEKPTENVSVFFPELNERH